MEKDTFDLTLREIYKDYYSHIRLICEEIKEEFNLNSPEDFQNCDDVHDRIHEHVDSSEWCFTYFKAKLVNVLSENCNAVSMHMGDDYKPENECEIAYWAMNEDVLDLLSNEYFYQKDVA